MTLDEASRAPPFADRYDIFELLGRGASGAVYRAQDIRAKRDVALKILQQDHLDPVALERFRREGQLTAALSHPGIARVHDAGAADGKAYIAYELIEGARSLTQACADLGRAERLEALLQTADALAFAHSHGVVHRDLKPDNILVNDAGTPRVTDFGIARVEGADRLTQTGTMLGTPSYMAPEQFGLGGKETVGAPADVWSLGVLLYELLTDRLPFEGTTLLELMALVTSQDPIPPRRSVAEIPASVQAVCLRALARAPGDRHPDAGAFAAELRAALAGTSGSPRTRPELRKLLLAIPVLLAAGLVAAAAFAPIPTADETPTLSQGARSPRLTHQADSGPESVPAEFFGWKVQRGQTLPPKVLEWTHLRRNKDGSQEVYDLRLGVQERIQEVAPRRIVIVATVQTLSLVIGSSALTSVRIDTEDSEAESLDASKVVGRELVMHVNPETGAVANVFGGDALDSEIRRAVYPLPFSGLVNTPQLRDNELRRIFTVLYLPLGAAPAPASSEWKTTYSYVSSAASRLLGVSTFRREGLSAVGTLERAHVVLDRTDETPATVDRCVEQRLTCGGGWVRESILRIELSGGPVPDSTVRFTIRFAER